MKTPLPEKGRYDMQNVQEQINNIMDYLAELTEVVEGKPTYRQGYEQGRFDAEMDEANLEFKQVTPTLKEQLLGEIRTDLMLDSWNEQVIRYKDIEAIINRLIP